MVVGRLSLLLTPGDAYVGNGRKRVARMVVQILCVLCAQRC